MSDRAARRVRAWRRLPRDDRRVLATCAVLHPLVRLSLRLRGLDRTVDALARLSRPRHAAPPPERRLGQARRIGRLANRAASSPALPVTCLTRSLTAQVLLGRRAIPADLRLGVRPDPAVAGGFAFHAWVEVDGAAVNDEPDHVATYLPFPLDGSGRRPDLAAFDA